MEGGNWGLSGLFGAGKKKKGKIISGGSYKGRSSMIDNRAM